MTLMHDLVTSTYWHVLTMKLASPCAFCPKKKRIATRMVVYILPNAPIGRPICPEHLWRAAKRIEKQRITLAAKYKEMDRESV